MDSELSICIWERHVRSCTFPYSLAAGLFLFFISFFLLFFFFKLVAAEVYSSLPRFVKDFWMSRSYIHPYAFTSDLVRKNSVRCSACICNTPSGSPLIRNNQTRSRFYLINFIYCKVSGDEASALHPGLVVIGIGRPYVLVIWFHNSL